MLVDAASELALFGVRYPEAPIFNDLVQGPFVAMNAQFATASVVGTNDQNLITGTALLSSDYKLRTYAAIKATGGAPTGLLWLDSFGIDWRPDDNTAAMWSELWGATSLVFVPSGSSRWTVIPLAVASRLNPYVTTTTANATTSAGSIPSLPFYRLPGGPIKCNLQTDQLYLGVTSGQTGPTLNSTAKGVFKMNGAWMPLGTAQNLGITATNVVGDCTPGAAASIAAVIAGRQSLHQISAGGLTG